LEQLLLQFERFDGRKRSGSSIGSKDDGVAALSLMWAEARGLHQVEEKNPEKAEEQRISEEKEDRLARKRAQYAAMFGGQTYTPPPPPTEPVVEKPTDPRMKVFGNRGPWRL
jgi:hypothetical protein